MTSIAHNKQTLYQAITEIHAKILLDYQRIPPQFTRNLKIEGNIKGTLVSVCDTLAYLIGWEQLVLKWYSDKALGITADLPHPEYQWNELGKLAQSFHRQYSHFEYAQLIDEFEAVTEQILALIDSLDDQQLYSDNWYKKYSLGRMIQLNTASPMKNMRSKIRKFNRDWVKEIP